MIVTGNQTKDRSHRNGNHQNHKAHDQCAAEAEDHAGENITPDLIGSEPVLGTGRQTGIRVVHETADALRIRNDYFCKDCEENRNTDKNQAEDRKFISAEFVTVDS